MIETSYFVALSWVANMKTWSMLKTWKVLWELLKSQKSWTTKIFVIILCYVFHLLYHCNIVCVCVYIYIYTHEKVDEWNNKLPTNLFQPYFSWYQSQDHGLRPWERHVGGGIIGGATIPLLSAMHRSPKWWWSNAIKGLNYSHWTLIDFQMRWLKLIQKWT